MKTISTLALLFLPMILMSQEYWSRVNDADRFSRTGNVSVYQDSMYLVTGTVSLPSCPFNKLFLYDKYGTLKWSFSDNNEIFYADNEYIYTAGHTFIDDVLNSDGLELAKYSKDGTKIDEIRIPEEFNDPPFLFKPKGMDSYSNGDLLICSDSLALITTSFLYPQTVYKFEKTLPVLSVKIIGNSHLLFSETGIFKASYDFNFSDSIIFNENLIQTEIANNIIYALFPNSLISLDLNLNILDTIYDDLNYKAKSISLNNNDLWIMLDGEEEIVLLNKNGENIDSLIFPVFSDIKHFHVSGTNFKFFGDTYTSHMCIINYENPVKNNPLPDFTDMEFLDLEVKNIKLVESPNPNVMYDSYILTLNAEIQNNSLDTLKSLVAYAPLRGGFNCARNFFHRKIQNFKIPPGEKGIVEIGGIHQYGIPSMDNICITLYSPNSSIELMRSNNRLCEEFLISGNSESILESLKIYPNPVNSVLFIDNLPLAQHEFKMLDLSGKELKRISSFGNETSIDLSDLQAGIYIIRIFSEGQVINRKIVVQ